MRAVFDAAGELHSDKPAEIRIGDCMVLVSSAGQPAFLYVHVEDVESVYQRALAAQWPGQESLPVTTLVAGPPALGPRALIYSVGLTDYLQDAFVLDLVNWSSGSSASA